MDKARNWENTRANTRGHGGPAAPAASHVGVRFPRRNDE